MRVSLADRHVSRNTRHLAVLYDDLVIQSQLDGGEFAPHVIGHGASKTRYHMFKVLKASMIAGLQRQ